MNDDKIVKTVFICLILCVTVASVASAEYPYGPKVSLQKNIEIVDLTVSPTTPIPDEPIDIVVTVRNNGESSENVRVVIKSEWWETIKEEEEIKRDDSQKEIKRDSSWINKWRSCCNRRGNQQNSQPSEVLTNFVGGPDDFVVGSQKSSIFEDMPKTSFLSNSSHIYHPNYRRLKHQRIIEVFDIVSLTPGESRSVKYRCRFSEVGGHIISARATSDHTSHFDSMSKSITVGVGEGVHDLGIVSVCDEYGHALGVVEMIEGKPRNIRVTIENVSKIFYEEAIVLVRIGGKDGRVLGADAVKIGAKEVGAVTISLDTEAIKPGTYELYVEVKPVEGEINLANNSTTKPLIVEEKQDTNRRIGR